MLTISATDSKDALASFSNTGNNIDLAAPGVGIKTTFKGGNYGSWSGTSFAAPVVAGVAALMIAANPALSGAEIQTLIMQAADDLGPPGWDPQFGYGRVNAAKAVSLAVSSNTSLPPPGNDPGDDGSSDAPPPPPPDTEPPVIVIMSPGNGAKLGNAANVNIEVNAADNEAVAKVELFVNGQLAATATVPPFATKFNAKKLMPGTHTIECRAFDAAGNAAWSEPVTVVK